MFVTGVVLALAIAMIVMERFRPGRVWPTVRTWWIRAIALNIDVRYAGPGWIQPRRVLAFRKKIKSDGSKQPV